MLNKENKCKEMFETSPWTQTHLGTLKLLFAKISTRFLFEDRNKNEKENRQVI